MAKRHHDSKKHMSKARYHEHAGMERKMHDLHHSKVHPKYDTLRHERDEFNDEERHNADPVRGGSYHYDREKDNMGGKYEGYRGRRHQEMMDSGMIHEDQREIANLPQNVMIKPYGDSYGYLPEDLDDTIRGIDRQIGYDDEKKMSHFYPKKV